MDRRKIARIIKVASANKISLARDFYKLPDSAGYASMGCEEMSNNIYWGIGRIFEDAFSSGMNSEKTKDIQELAKIWGKLDDPKVISKLTSLHNKVGGIMSRYNNIERSKIKEVVIRYIDGVISGTIAIKNKKTKETDIAILEEALVLLQNLRGIVFDVYDGKSKTANDYANQIIGNENEGLLNWWITVKNDMLSKSNNAKLNQIMQIAVSWLQIEEIPKKKNYAKDSSIAEYDSSLFEEKVNLDLVDEESARFFEVLKEKTESLAYIDDLERENIEYRREIQNLEKEIDEIDEKIDNKEISLEVGDLEISAIERKIDEKGVTIANNKRALSSVRAGVQHLRQIIGKYNILEFYYKVYRRIDEALFYDIFSFLNFNVFLNALKSGASAEDIEEAKILIDAALATINEHNRRLAVVNEEFAKLIEEHPIEEVEGVTVRIEGDQERENAEKRKAEREARRKKKAGQKDIKETKETVIDSEKPKERLSQMENAGSGRPVDSGWKSVNSTNTSSLDEDDDTSSASNLEENLKKKIKLKGGYNAPPVSLLDTYDKLEPDLEDFEFMKDKIDKMMAEFGVPAEVISAKKGPTFTRYELTLGEGYKVNKLSSLVDNFKMRLEVEHLRILTPIGGKNALGLEIPNQKRLIVGLKGIIESDRFSRQTDGIDLCFGVTNDGEKHIADLAKMPHLLVAGATGTGKSVFLKSILVGLIYKYSPEDLRMILIDPKRVDLSMYKNIPHLLVPDTIKEYQEAVDVLEVLVKEMEHRYKILEDAGCSNIAEYNKVHPDAKMYRIVLIVDEMADLMMRAKGSTAFEDSVVRLAQLARASGIHMILATQRPVVEFITGSIKSNIVSRVAFKVQSGRESSIVLDETGAEELLGLGDMLFSSPDSGLVRLQGAYISLKEIKDVCNYVKENNVIISEDDQGTDTQGFDDEIADIDDITK